MTDRELLELAAKAAGFVNYSANDDTGVCVEHGSRRGAITSYWNPLTHDGDALRLAVKLHLKIDVMPWGANATKWDESMSGGDAIRHNDDPYAATRRAIVRAAAEVGRRTE